MIEVGDEHLPYAPADLVAARSWLGRLPGVDIEQRHLADLWEQSAEDAPDLVPSAWLDGGPTTTVRELREASPGITVMLNTQQYPDHDQLLRYDERMRSVRKRAETEGRKPTLAEATPRDDEQGQLAAVILPMPSPPRRLDWRGWGKYNGIPVVLGDEVSYDPNRGAEWRKERRK